MLLDEFVLLDWESGRQFWRPRGPILEYIFEEGYV